MFKQYLVSRRNGNMRAHKVVIISKKTVKQEDGRVIQIPFFESILRQHIYYFDGSDLQYSNLEVLLRSRQLATEVNWHDLSSEIVRRLVPQLLHEHLESSQKYSDRSQPYGRDDFSYPAGVIPEYI